ncbi:MAG TPA: DUF4328 domain-containing protein [Micropepsaceae bacterium]|nr:DUF4328 domain-containing protein [Micropepsaceae bacterium]
MRREYFSEYHYPQGLTLRVRTLYTGMMITCGMSIWFAVRDIAILEGISSRGFSSVDALKAAIETGRERATSAYSAARAIWLGAFVGSLMWIWRMARNARALSIARPKVTPEWAVFSHFIPIINLVAPYLAMREIVRCYTPKEDASDSPLLPYWALLVFHFLGAMLISIRGSTAVTPADFILLDKAIIFFEVVNIAAAIFFIAFTRYLVRKEALELDDVLDTDEEAAKWLWPT